MPHQTEVPKTFKHGFILTEQELRRVSGACREQLAKAGDGTVEESYIAHLKDHTVIESETVDDILSLENGGHKQVIRLEMSFTSGDHKIEIRFKDAHQDPKSWESVGFDVSSSERDWAFLTASDLEDRVTKLKFFSLPHWWTASGSSTLLNGVFLVLLIWFFNAWVQPRVIEEVDKPSELREAYEAGEFANATEAIIFLEELKSDSYTHWYYLAYFAAIFILPFVLSWSMKGLANKLYSAYVFKWGDQVDLHQRSMGRVKILFVAIGLGAVASVIGSIIMKVIWP